MAQNEAKIRLSVDGAQKAVGDVGRVGDSLKKLNADTVAAAGGSGRLADAIGRVAQYGIAAGGIYAAAQAISAVGRALFDASAQAQRLTTQLNFATSGNGTRELAFVSQVANRLGLELNSTAKAYAGFASAARGTSLEGERARNVFESIAMASAVMGLSADESSGALLAVQQMMSKGVVSAEEFRGQLGERMPIALRAGAAALGVTEAAFGKMLETGQIVAAEFLPKFGDAIRREIGQAADEAAGRLDASVARMGNAWERLKQVVGDSGISRALAGAAGWLASDMTAVSEAMDRAKVSGAGFFGQANAGLGQFIGRSVGLQLVNRDFLTMEQAVADATATIRRFDDQEKRDGKLSIYAMGARAEAARDLAKANRELAASGKANQGGGAGRGSINPETIGETAARKAKDQDALNSLRLKLAKVPEGYLKDMQEVIRLNQLGVLVGKEYTGVLSRMQEQLVKAPTAAAAMRSGNDALAERMALMAQLYGGPNGMQASVAVDLRRAEIAETDAVNAQLLAANMADQARATDTAAKATDTAAKAHAGMIKQLAASADSVAAQVQKLHDEEQAATIAAAGNISLAEAIELVTVARLHEQKAVQMSFGDEQAADAIQREIDKRRELAGLIAGKEARQASADSAKEAAADWKKTSDSINQSLTDALFRSFESGKGFGRTLRDSLVNTFKTMVLRPIISAIVSPVSGAITGAMGFSGAAGAGGSSMGSMAGSAASSALSSSAFGAAGASIFGSSAAYGAAIGTTSIGAGSQAAMLAAQTGQFGLYGAAATSSAAAGAGAGAASVGSAAMAAIPYVAIALAVANAMGMFRSEKKTGGGLVGTFGAGNISDAQVIRTGGTLFRGPDYDTQITGISASSKLLQEAFSGLRVNTAAQAAALGLSTDSIRGFTTAIGSDVMNNDAGTRGLSLQGLTAAQAQAKIAEALQTVNEKMAEMVLGIGQTITESVVDAVSMGVDSESGAEVFANITRQVSRFVAGAGDDFRRTGETAVQTLGRLSGSLSAVNGVLGLLGAKLYATTLAGGDLASQLADLFGGLSNFKSTTGAYFEAYFTDSERAAALTGQLSGQMRALGYSLPATRLEFRKLVEAQDLSTDAGRRSYAALVQLSGAFASVTAESVASTAAAEAAADAAERAAGIARERLGLEERLLTAQGNTVELRRRELAALDPANRALQQRLYDISDATAAAEQAGKLRDAWRSVGDTIADEVARIRGSDGAGSATLAGVQSAFVVATVQARAGGQSAAAKLPELSRKLLELAEANAGSTAELAAARSAVADSLEKTANSAYAIGDIAAGGAETRLRDALADPLRPLGTAIAAIGTAMASSEPAAAPDMAAVLAELRALSAAMSGLRIEAQAAAVNTNKSTRQMQELIDRGLVVRTDADAPLATVPA